MNQMGLTVYLQASLERLYIRLSIARKQRPLIKDKSDEELREFIAQQLAKREPYYSRAAHTFMADKLENKAQIESSVDAFCQQFSIP